MQFKWWYQDQSSQLIQALDDDFWLEMSKDDFDIFRRSKVPSITSGTGNSSAKVHAGGDVNSNIVMSFQKSIKLDVGQYPDFKGNLEGWLPFKWRLKAVAATHGIERVIGDVAPEVLPGTQDSRLYDKQNSFLYSVFTQKLRGGPAVLALRAAEDSKDARAVFTRLVEHYESTSNLMVISQKCHSRIQGLKLTRQFRGGAQAFVTQLQNAFLDLEYCTGVDKNDLEKKTTLLLAIEDSNFYSIRDTLAMDSSKDFLDALAAIDQHATMFIATEKKTNRKVNSANKQQGRSKKENAKKNGKDNHRAKNGTKQEKLPNIDQSVWEQLPGAVRKFIAEHNRNQRNNASSGNSNSANAGANENATRQANTVTIDDQNNTR